jgi:hypothetical protein
MGPIGETISGCNAGMAKLRTELLGKGLFS